MKIPTGHQTIMPYIIVKEAGKFMDFLKNVFGAEETAKYMRNESEIMHAEVNINGSTVMFAGSTGQWQAQNAGMFIYVEDVDKTYKKALEQGATSLMEIEDKEYGRSGGIRDPFGNVWWITTIK
ncbi:MAG TPA: VOC family protein [Cytophagales bacterium]|nr:VOC family protein [Cytophagales bacterium]